MVIVTLQDIYEKINKCIGSKEYYIEGSATEENGVLTHVNISIEKAEKDKDGKLPSWKSHMKPGIPSISLTEKHSSSKLSSAINSKLAEK